MGTECAIWFLAGVFLWSGVAKLRQPESAATSMVAFGIASRARPVLGAALGMSEVLLSIALGARLFPRLGLYFATSLLVFFSILISRSLWSGHRFACFCFGDADSQLSGWTAVRTIALASVALTAAVGPGIGSIRPLSGSLDLLPVMVAASVLGIAVLASRIPRLLKWSRDLTPRPRARVSGTS